MEKQQCNGCKMIAKIKRILDKKAIEKIKEIGYCEYCGYSYQLQVHHIKTKGSGGNDTDDNLICLCWKCHRLTHDGKIDRDKLREIVRGRNEYRDITTSTIR